MTAPTTDTTVASQTDTNLDHARITPRDTEQELATVFAPPPRVQSHATGWHIYTVPDLHYGRSPTELIDRCHKMFAGYPQLTPEADQRLHATIAWIPGTADALDATARAVLPPLALTGGSIQGLPLPVNQHSHNLARYGRLASASRATKQATRARVIVRG
jgi:hypothetical protein